MIIRGSRKKSQGGRQSFIDLWQLNQFIDSPHFRREGLHITSVHSPLGQYRHKGHIPDSSNGQLTFQNGRGDLLGSKIPFRLAQLPMSLQNWQSQSKSFATWRTCSYICAYPEQQLIEYLSTVLAAWQPWDLFSIARCWSQFWSHWSRQTA